MDRLTSRYFTTDDLRWEQCIYHISLDWWSRLYEYPWSASFCNSDLTVLDAGCGVGHHFKFYLAQTCKEVHACDLDSCILNEKLIIDGIKESFNYDVTSLNQKINYQCCDLNQMKYPDNYFDRIFCISVLEHCEPGEVVNILTGFKRLLKTDGLIVLTFDVPTNNLLDVITQNLETLNLTLAGDLLLERPENAIYNKTWELYCFRMVLKIDQL